MFGWRGTSDYRVYSVCSTRTTSTATTCIWNSVGTRWVHESRRQRYIAHSFGSSFGLFSNDEAICFGVWTGRWIHRRSSSWSSGPPVALLLCSYARGGEHEPLSDGTGRTCNWEYWCSSLRWGVGGHCERIVIARFMVKAFNSAMDSSTYNLIVLLFYLYIDWFLIIS